ncbi:MAG: hypothetical protein INQ03_03420 [Candidatus Heimdallarchaeota archaeon]|nr:hypothetical protein [Candidatus Heimdallarchaeota archaeon]
MSVLEPTQSVVNALCIYQDKLIAGLGSYSVEIIDLNSMEKVSNIELNSEVRDMIICDNFLYVACLAEEIVVIDLDSMRKLHTLEFPLGVTNLHHNKEYLFALGFNKETRVFDLKSHELIGTLNGVDSKIQTVTTNDHFIVSGGCANENSNLIYWNEQLQPIHNIEIEAEKIVETFIHEDFVILGTSGPNKMEIWSLGEKKPIARKLGYRAPINAIAASNRNIFVAAAGTMYIYNTKNYEFEASLTEPYGVINAIVTTNDHVIYSSRNKLIFRDVRTFDFVHSMEF